MAKLFQTTSINPTAILRVLPVDATNDTLQGFNAAEDIRIKDATQRAAAEEQSYKRSKDSLDRQTEGFSAMLKDPQNAEMIAGQYGLQYNDTTRAMLANPQKAQLMIDGAKMAKNMGITNPEAAKAFVGSYIESGGNFDASSKATDGMQMASPKLTGSVSGGIWDQQTGTVIRPPEPSYQKFGSDGIWNPKTREMVREPSPAYQAPYRNPALPLELQIEGEALVKSAFPDPTAINEWVKKTAPFTAQQSLAPVPAGEIPNGKAASDAFYGAPASPPQPSLNVGDKIPLPAALPPAPRSSNTNSELLQGMGF